jgi:FkbM family methyltransferase
VNWFSIPRRWCTFQLRLREFTPAMPPFFAGLQVIFYRLGRHSFPVQFSISQARFPLWMRFGTSDAQVFRQIFCEGEYGCLDGLAPGLIIDCGANVGYSSVYFLNRFPGAFVIALEPFPENFRMLQKNLAPYRGRCLALRQAVWSRPARLCFGERAYSPGQAWSVKVREALGTEPGDVEAVSIGQILDKSGFARIAILKVDVEGAEREIFSHGIEWLPRTDNIVIELHDAEAERIFAAAVDGQNFSRSQSGELAICRRL